MKRWKLIEILVNYIYHDNIFLMSPVVDWKLLDVLNVNFRSNYDKVRPVLKKWQEKGYVNLIEDENILLIFNPENLPEKDKLMEEST